MPYLLDTNIWIYAYRNQGACRTRIDRATPKQLHLCAVTLFEIEFGIAKSSNPLALRTFLAEIQKRHPLADFNALAAQQAGQLRAQLQAQGHPIGPYDLLIASIALAHNLTLVTRNVKEFERVPALQVENWYEE